MDQRRREFRYVRRKRRRNFSADGSTYFCPNCSGWITNDRANAKFNVFADRESNFYSDANPDVLPDICAN